MAEINNNGAKLKMAVIEGNIVKSPFQDVQIKNCDLWEILGTRMKTDPAKIAIVDGKTGVQITYRKLLDEVENIAWNLLDQGFYKFSPLSVFMKTSVEYILIALAVWRLGGTVVGVNPLQTAEEVAKILKQVPCDIIVCDEFNAAAAVKGSAGTTIKKVFSKCKGNAPKGTISFTTLKTKRTHLGACKANPGDPALIMFSSGTTGPPKAVVISHRALVGQIRIWGGPEMDNLPVNCGVLYMPLAHIFGITLTLIHVAFGCKLVVMEQFDLEEYIKLVATHRSDKLILVPPIAIQLSKSKLFSKYDLSCVQSISIGAAPLGKDTEDELKRLGGEDLLIKQMFGMTEVAGGALSIPTSMKNRFPHGTVGVPFPCVSAKVVDIDTGINLGPNKSGELCLKCEFFMTEYLNNPTATANTIDKEGWLHTGDIGYYTEQGCIFIIDRIKELIKYNAYQVAPAELEAVLLQHPDIADTGVTGLPDKLAGEVPHAWVVMKHGSSITENEIHRFLNEKVAPFKKIRGGIRFVKSIPKSPSGKILRREIKRQSLEYIPGSKL